MTKEQLLEACRVPAALLPQSFGLWSIERRSAAESSKMNKGRRIEVGWPTYTLLRRVTKATLHHEPPGEVVMDDTLTELRKHLPILMHARGRVLMSGLGLGCALRGLLASPKVEHVDVVELDPDVLRVCGAEFEGDPKVTMHLGDALQFPWPESARWDYAWHDIWDEDGTQVLHARLILRFIDKVKFQGAWMLPREAKRVIRRKPKITTLIG